MNIVEEYFDKHAENWDSYAQRSAQELNDLLKDVTIKKGDKVLDLACGTGVITNLLYNKAKTDLYAIDISKKMIEIANKKNTQPNIHFQAIDFLNYKEKDFDAIILFDAYPHFLDVIKFKNHVSKALKRGGFLYIIHDCGRDELNNHHMTFAKDVSRLLLPPLEEAKQYHDNFYIIKAFENNKTYQIYLRKK